MDKKIIEEHFTQQEIQLLHELSDNEYFESILTDLILPIRLHYGCDIQDKEAKELAETEIGHHFVRLYKLLLSVYSHRNEDGKTI